MEVKLKEYEEKNNILIMKLEHLETNKIQVFPKENLLEELNIEKEMNIKNKKEIEDLNNLFFVKDREIYNANERIKKLEEVLNKKEKSSQKSQINNLERLIEKNEATIHVLESRKNEDENMLKRFLVRINFIFSS